MNGLDTGGRKWSWPVCRLWWGDRIKVTYTFWDYSKASDKRCMEMAIEIILHKGDTAYGFCAVCQFSIDLVLFDIIFSRLNKK